MNFRRKLHIIAVALILSLSVIALHAFPALAVGEDIALDPEEGEIGDRIDIDGEDFEESVYDTGSSTWIYSYVDIYFSRDEADEGDDIDDEVENYELVRSQRTVDESGNFSTYFDVPDELTDGVDDETVYGGTYYVYVTYHNDDNIVVLTEFTVIAADITLSQDEGPVDTEVTITGVDFDTNEDITVEFDDDEIDIESGDTDTDSDGEFECTIIIPESIGGDHTITVTDDAGAIAETEYTVTPDIDVNPTSGAASTVVTVTGTGFGDEVDFEITLDGSNVADGETDDNGSFEITFRAPAKSAGTYDVEVEDDDNNSADAEFSYAKADVSISPTSGYAATEITVNGTGFKANQDVTVTFNGDTVASASTDNYGRVTDVTFDVPAVGAGTYAVEVSDGTNSDQTNFTILTSASISTETSEDSPGYVGMPLTVSGVGFIADTVARVTYQGIQLATTNVDSSGSFDASFEAPASEAKSFTITVTDGTNTVDFDFYLESSPPSKIFPQLPYLDAKLEEGKFDWSGDANDLTREVTDASLPVTYRLQVATSGDFSRDTILLDVSGITESEYTIPDEIELAASSSSSPYYWRVKAVDSAFNEGAWSGIGTFHVGDIWGILTYVLAGVGALLLGVLGFWLGRRADSYRD